MKKSIIILTILLPIIVFAQPAQKTTLAVMGFSYTGISQDVGILINDTIVIFLVKSNRFNILERSIRDGILKDKGFIPNLECGEPNCLLEAGKNLSVEKVIGANIRRIDNKWSAKIFLIDVNSNTAKLAVLREHEGKVDQLLAYLKLITQNILQDSGAAKVQLESTQKTITSDGLSLVDYQDLILTQDNNIKDITDIGQPGTSPAEIETQRKVDAEKMRQKILSENLLAEKRKKTVLKMPVLTYSALGSAAILSYVTYRNYVGAKNSYNKYIYSTTEEEAVKYRNETENKNKIAALCSYASVSLCVVGVVTWFIKKKAHPELSASSPDIDISYKLPSHSFDGKNAEILVTWKF